VVAGKLIPQRIQMPGKAITSTAGRHLVILQATTFQRAGSSSRPLSRYIALSITVSPATLPIIP
jgi:hypothetical protein